MLESIFGRLNQHTPRHLHYSILDDKLETATFQKQPRTKRSKRFHYVMTTHVPAPDGVSRR